MGTAVGLSLRSNIGAVVCFEVGSEVFPRDGLDVGFAVGGCVGIDVGPTVDEPLGLEVG